MLNDILHPVQVAAVNLAGRRRELDQTVYLVNEAMRRALLEGVALDRVAAAANMSVTEMLSRTGLHLRGLDAPDGAATAAVPKDESGPERTLEPTA